MKTILPKPRVKTSERTRTRYSPAPVHGETNGKVLLVPVDFSAESTKALKAAADIARKRGAAIHLLHVVEPQEFIYDCGYGPVRRKMPNRALIDKARSRLTSLGRRHLGREFQWEASVRSGTAFEEIVAAARESLPEFVIIPTRGMTKSEDIPFGSTAERVVRLAGCPVLVLPKPLLLRRTTT